MKNVNRYDEYQKKCIIVTDLCLNWKLDSESWRNCIDALRNKYKDVLE